MKELTGYCTYKGIKNDTISWHCTQHIVPKKISPFAFITRSPDIHYVHYFLLLNSVLTV